MTFFRVIASHPPKTYVGEPFLEVLVRIADPRLVLDLRFDLLMSGEHTLALKALRVSQLLKQG